MSAVIAAFDQWWCHEVTDCGPPVVHRLLDVGLDLRAAVLGLRAIAGDANGVWRKERRISSGISGIEGSAITDHQLHDVQTVFNTEFRQRAHGRKLLPTGPGIVSYFRSETR